MTGRAIPPLAAAALAVGLALGGCGGGGDDSTTSTAAKAATLGANDTKVQAQPQTGASSGSATTPVTTTFALGSPSDVPRSKGGDNSIQDYGSEASTDDRVAAGFALHGYFKALASGDTAKACALLTSRTRDGIARTLQQLQQQAQGGGQVPSTCPEILAVTVSGASSSGQTRIKELLSLRRQNDDAFLVYRAKDGTIYSMPMGNEDGDWRVAAVSASPLAG
jgi:hypothetical protein